MNFHSWLVEISSGSAVKENIKGGLKIVTIELSYDLAVLLSGSYPKTKYSISKFIEALNTIAKIGYGIKLNSGSER